MAAESSTMAIITKAAAAVGAGGFFLKLYDEVRGLMGPSTEQMRDYADKMEANLRLMERTADDLYRMRLEALNHYERTPRSKGWIDEVNELKELDESVKNIGLCGMPGVGKTAIMQNLNNSEQAEDFDIVIFDTLPDKRSREKLNFGNGESKPDALKLAIEKLNFGNGESKPDALKLAIEKLRQVIAARLHLKIEEGMTDFDITSRISEKLKDKKCLFLLDDVWHPFKLNDIGICSNEGNKVILASRNKNACRDMNIDAIEEMERLPMKEGVILFRKNCVQMVSVQNFIKRLKSEDVENIDNAIISSLVIATTDDTFELIGHKEAWDLSKFGIENINELKCLIIEGAKNIQAVIDAKGTMEGVLKRLERIYISNVPMLESIFWEGHVPGGSLAELAVFHLSNCPNLKKIFSSAMIKQLSNLQHLHIENCPQIEQIIVESRNDGSEQLMLPSLRTCVLRNLPELKSFSKNDLICPF
ncbi:hypothetical protein GH714_023831 [Hevea brasiliensis]|uniref:Uncharacterized protein n=1 Tax=Hevea brasiliensis TaxID=3981 RepID=A0A6A6N473_HEVBR|nr:hypothetical protein GH714_023831 [Hevea brasiliensis]